MFSRMTSYALGQSIMQKSGYVEIQEGQIVNDLIVVDCHVEIYGIVRGIIYSLDSVINVEPSAVIAGNINANRGQLNISTSALLPSYILVVDGSFCINQDFCKNAQEDVTIGRKNVYTIPVATGTTLELVSGSLSSDMIDLIKEYLIFPRQIPVGPFSIARWQQISMNTIGLDTVHSQQDISHFRIDGLTDILVNQLPKKQSFTGKFEKMNKRVVLTAIQFGNMAQTEHFWNQYVRKRIDENRVRQSIHVNFGAGAHWFFRFQNQFVVMWEKENWFICMEAQIINNNLNDEALLAMGNVLRKRALDELVAQIVSYSQ